jgi:hypothetical protein
MKKKIIGYVVRDNFDAKELVREGTQWVLLSGTRVTIFATRAEAKKAIADTHIWAIDRRIFWASKVLK